MKRVNTFLKNHWDGKSPLLLGYSGGPDSKALLYALLEAGCKNLEVAHVDHGWRKESFEEAECIRKEIHALGLSFHTTQLSCDAKGNREDFARNARLSFFQTLFAKKSFQALVLGHHADDLAETSLKRLLEGAHIPFLGGMQPVSSIRGMPIWRPLLSLRKKELFLFLEKRQCKAFSDPTNFDPSYLRSRLRKEAIPQLCRCFGKQIVENLCQLSTRAYELQKYLDQKITHCLVETGDWGFAIFGQGMEKLELRYLLQKKALENGLVLPRTVLEPVLEWIKQEKVARKIFFHSTWIVIRGGWCFFLASDAGKALPEKGFLRKLMISLDAKRSKPVV